MNDENIAFTCAVCNKSYSNVLKSKIAWQEVADGNGLALVVSKEPNTPVIGNVKPVCQMCTMKFLTGLLVMECEELNDVITGAMAEARGGSE